MRRKSMTAITMSFLLVATILAGCGNNEQAEVKETTDRAATKTATFDKTEIGNVIAKDPVKLSDLLYKVVLKKGQTVKEASLFYGGETIKLETGKDPTTGTKLYTAAKDKAIKELVDKNNVPNAILTFTTPTKTASDLKVSFTLVDKDKKTSTESVNIKVHVLPETIKPVKAITQNLKLSENLKDYDFDVRAKNIADKVKEVESITVKKSDVKFGRAGHYTVTYEVKLAPENVDVTTDTEVVDKETEKDLPKDEVVKENVKPDSTVEVETDVEVTDKKDDGVIADEKDTTANTDNNASSGGGSNTPSGSGSSAPSDSGGNASSDVGGGSSSNAGGGSSSSNAGGGSGEPKPAPHTHSWKAHTTTKIVWVPNVVTVDDYENRAQHTCDSICGGCGGRFNSPAECSNHQLNGCTGSRQNVACIHTERVAVGSHTEDHGHNETQTYTDYEYCDCGATR